MDDSAQQPSPRKNRRTLVTGLIIGFVLLVGVGAVVALASRFEGHNWALGVAPQQSTANIDKVERAVRAEMGDALIALEVKNANSSGTPFGHTVNVTMLVDTGKVNDATISRLQSDVVDAIRATGVKDTFSILIAKNIDTTAEADVWGSAQKPLVDLEDVRFEGDTPVEFKIN